MDMAHGILLGVNIVVLIIGIVLICREVKDW